MTSEVTTTKAAPPAAPGPGPVDLSTSPWWRSSLRWESGLVAVLVAVLIYGVSGSDSFFSSANLYNLGQNIGYIAIMALPLTFIVMTGEIDLSVASMLGLSGSVLGDLWHHNWGFAPALIVALLVGVAGGALNGFLVVKVGLPSIAVTIGTLTLYRGLAEILLGSATIPASVTGSSRCGSPRWEPRRSRAPSSPGRRCSSSCWPWCSPWCCT